MGRLRYALAGRPLGCELVTFDDGDGGEVAGEHAGGGQAGKAPPDDDGMVEVAQGRSLRSLPRGAPSGCDGTTLDRQFAIAN